MNGTTRPIGELNREDIASYLDMLEAQSGGMRSLRFQPGQTSPYSREDLQNQLNVLTETQRVLATGNRPFLGMEGDLPGSLAAPPAPGGWSPGMGMPEEAPLRPADRQPTPPLPPPAEVTVRPQPPVSSVPMYQPAAPPPQAAALPAPVPAPQAAPAPAASSGVSGNTLLGLAAITDALAILGGRQPTMLAQMAPIAQQRSQQQALTQIIQQRMQGALSPQQATILGNAVQQAGAAAGGGAPQAAGEVPVLRAAPGQDPNEVRGVRTNNPLNLSFANQPNAIGTDGRFAVFQTPEEGVAASVRQLTLYGQRGLNTVEQIVGRWAPPSENDTPAYIRAVSQRMNVNPNQEIDLSDPNTMSRLVNAMSVQEVGRVIPEDVLRRGVEIGYQPPQQRAQLTPEQRAIAAPTAAAPGAGAPGTALRPRGVEMTPQLAATLQALPPAEALKLLTQLDLQAAQQRGNRILSEAEARSIYGNRYDPSKLYEITQEGTPRPVAGTIESREEKDIQQENSLRRDFTTSKPVVEFLTMGPQIRSIRDAVTRTEPSRFNDINLVYAFAKMLDPTSVVRETEYGMVIEAQGAVQRVFSWGARIAGQSAFNEQTRREILREAEGRYSATKEAYDIEVDATKELAKRYGVNPERVIPPRRELSQAGPIPGSPEAQAGQTRVSGAERPQAITRLQDRVRAGEITLDQAKSFARSMGIPDAERFFQ